MPTIDSMKIIKEDKKDPGFFSKFLLLGVLPIIYTIGLGMVILHFTGVSFQTQVKWIEDHTKSLMAQLHETTKKEASTIENTAKKESTNSAANSSKSETASSASSDTSNAVANQDVTQNNTVNNQTSSSNQANNQSMNSSTVANTLANVDPKNAAKLLSNMPEAEAIKNLKLLDPDVQTAIIAEMSAEEGAVFAVALDKGYEGESTTQSASQVYQYLSPEQIASILNGISDKSEVLRQIQQLDPNIASKVLSKINPTVAGWIVSQMD